MITKEIIKREMDFYRKAELKYSNMLASLPVGNLYFKNQHGKRRPYFFDGKEEKYLSRQNADMIACLTARKCLIEALRRIRGNIEALGHIYGDYIDFYDTLPSTAAGCLMKEHINSESLRRLSHLDFEHMTAGNDIRQWLRMPAKQNPYKSEEKIHITASGIKVRSKSELIIGSFLEFNNIPYKYEEQLILDGNMIYPDFTVKRASDGKIIIWEHFGMMDDPGYVENTRYKRFLYEENGYMPYDNFIATYSSGRGSVNMMLIEKIAAVMLV